MILESDLENWFTHHPPSPDQDIVKLILEAGKNLALIILEATPPSADQSAAIRQVREAVMTAKEAIACGSSPVVVTGSGSKSGSVPGPQNPPRPERQTEVG